MPSRSSRDIRRRGVFGLRDQILGNLVINIFCKPSQPSRQLFEMSLCALCSDTLESALQGIGSMSWYFSDTLAGMYLAIAVNSEILDTEINTKHTNRIIWRRFRNLDYNSEIEDVFDEYKIGLASDPVQPGFLIDSDSDRDEMPAFKSDQGNVLKSFPCEDTRVVNDSTIGPKLGLIDLSLL